jgi:hypothetical protein
VCRHHPDRQLAGSRQLIVATGIANVWAWQPGGLRAAAESLATDFPGRFILGLGVSHAPAVEALGHAYLKLPNYTGNLERFGFGPADFAGAGSDRLISQVIPNGPVALRQLIKDHLEAGADHVVVQPLDPGGFTTAALTGLAASIVDL